MYTSEKVIDGFSTVFRQWKAKDSHCKFLHGYALSFKLVFESETLDERNWVQDFGFLKKSKFKMDGHELKFWFDYMFDHTVIISYDDPEKEYFKDHNNITLQLRVMENVGCEAFAAYVFSVVSLALKHDVGDRVKLRSVTCIENHKNSATYEA